ncbi:Co2+/Mg2+ efflux protein ApaG [Enterobacteriaceae endosymbiont of Neohaemonia nigricornis]|uniref:Co2+/Mg2+ efflux protein ApaG n=1 Tax=Enterobacteriaceae endosymbiont of Neohaemonia nigricornis TaxID=2675792 RepID=UPI0014498FB7|nr:Co2+/Mg2+ efflux protein ApaG [Enterobacteriaceae endosymbiont of Neohaemonia nigricornis]QJC30360.1 Co2+/Mg2+ efflux protein ApaG [Enterobacteriaceae endosymbiont of Neohaemonia nigricornis]
MKILSQVYIKVHSVYIKSQSTPEINRYVFAYTINIHNISKKILKLISHYLLITNGHGKKTQVHGSNIITKHAYINPGNDFHYTSGTVLETPIGTMQGHYIMIDEKNDIYHIDIPVFRLAIKTYIH